MLANKFPDSNIEKWMTCEAFLPQARYVIQYKNITDNVLGQYSSLLQNIAQFDQMQARYEITLTNSETALEVLQKLFGLEHPETLVTMTVLANRYLHLGRLNEAEELQVQVIDRSTRVFKEEHPQILANMGYLAAIWIRQGRWDEAEKLQVRVMNASIRALGEEHPNVTR